MINSSECRSDHCPYKDQEHSGLFINMYLHVICATRIECPLYITIQMITKHTASTAWKSQLTVNRKHVTHVAMKNKHYYLHMPRSVHTASPVRVSWVTTSLKSDVFGIQIKTSTWRMRQEFRHSFIICWCMYRRMSLANATRLAVFSVSHHEHQIKAG